MAARVPRPGEPVRGSRTGRPLMAAMDLLGRRWALRILWELRAEPLGARALQARCDQMSSSVLYERLEELTAAALLTRDGAGAYPLTELGTALAPAGGIGFFGSDSGSLANAVPYRVAADRSAPGATRPVRKTCWSSWIQWKT